MHAVSVRCLWAKVHHILGEYRGPFSVECTKICHFQTKKLKKISLLMSYPFITPSWKTVHPRNKLATPVVISLLWQRQIELHENCTDELLVVVPLSPMWCVDAVLRREWLQWLLATASDQHRSKHGRFSLSRLYTGVGGLVQKMSVDDGGLETEYFCISDSQSSQLCTWTFCVCQEVSQPARDSVGEMLSYFYGFAPASTLSAYHMC